MQNGTDPHIPLWLQWAITLGIPGAIGLWAKWSAGSAVDQRIDKKMEPVHVKLDSVTSKVDRILGYLSGPETGSHKRPHRDD